MSKITKSAKGEECQIRIPGYCNGDPETTVFCHVNGGGMGMKQIDIEGSFGCSSCHDIVDFRNECVNWTRNQVIVWHHEGCMRTRKILINKGLIVLK